MNNIANIFVHTIKQLTAILLMLKVIIEKEMGCLDICDFLSYFPSDKNMLSFQPR